MKKARSRSIYILPLATIFILGIIYLAIRTFFDLNDYKSNIEYAVSNKTNSKVRIDGLIDYSLFPPYITIEKLNISKRDSSSFYAGHLKLYPSITSLLLMKINFKEIEIDSFNVNLYKSSSGLFNFSDTSKSLLELPQMPEKSPIYEVQLSRGNINFTNSFTKDTISLCDINGIVEDISITPHSKDIKPTLSFTSNFTISSGSFNWVEIGKREIASDCIKNKVSVQIIDPLKEIKDEQFILQLDFSKPLYFYKLNYSVNNFEAAKYLEMKDVQGTLSTSISLALTDSANSNLLSNCEGKYISKGSNWVFNNLSLDNVVSQNENSRIIAPSCLWNFWLSTKATNHILNLTKLNSVNNLTQNNDTLSLHSEWEITAGILEPIKTMLYNSRDTISVIGNIDLQNKKFQNFELVKKSGVGSKPIQKLHGPFNEVHLSR